MRIILHPSTHPGLLSPFLLFFIRAPVTINVLTYITAKTLTLGIFALNGPKTPRPESGDKLLVLPKTKQTLHKNDGPKHPLKTYYNRR